MPLVTVVAEEDSEAVSCNRSLVLTVTVEAAFTKGLTPNTLVNKNNTESDKAFAWFMN